MFLDYLKKAVERVLNAPQSKIYSPQPCRSWELPDGQFVVADTYDETEMDKKDYTKNPSFLDYFRAKQKPPVIGALSSNTALTSSQFAQQFIEKFNQLAVYSDEHRTENGAPMGAQADVSVDQPAE